MASIQEKMFSELRDKSLFEKANDYGFQYINDAIQRTVFPTAEAINNLKIFDEEMPWETSRSVDIIQTLHQYGSPATVSQIGGRYYGFVCGGVVPAGLAAKNLATYWDQNTAMYVMSPLSAKLENVVEKWLKTLFNLPESAVAGFVSGTTMANLCGLAAARYRLLKNQNWDVNKKGLFHSPSIKIIAGKQAHSAITRAINILGLGEENITYIDTDNEGRINSELIPKLDNKTLLILQAGNINSGSFDDFDKICAKAKNTGAWIHIDGAFGLWAAAANKLSYLTSGIQYANSWAADAHKTLNTPYDNGIVLCNDKEALAGALQIAGAYLVLSDERDSMLYTPEMSKRSRIIELWATLKYLGRKGLDEMVWNMHQRATQFAKELSAVDGFKIINDVVFNQVMVKCKSDALTNKVLEKVQQERVCWVGGSTWNGKKVIRISVCSWATTEEDVTLSVESFKTALKASSTIL